MRCPSVEGMAAPGDTAVRRAAVVINPIKVNEGALRLAVAKAEREAGWAPSLWIETSESDAGVGMAHEALAQGVDLVLAAGGDGTVRAVAEALTGTGVAFGIVPSGTGNLLARNLSLPLANTNRAVRVAFSGNDRAIDVGELEATLTDGSVFRRIFLVMAGIGIDAQMLANTNPELKRRVGWLAYVDAILRSLRRQERVHLHYRLDDGPTHSMTVHTLLVGNCGALPGDVALLPDASLDDGILDVVALRPRGLGGWVRLWATVTWQNGVLRRSTVGRAIVGTGKPIRAMRYARARSIEARFSRPEDFELDGEPGGAATSIAIRVLPGALVVRVA